MLDSGNILVPTGTLDRKRRREGEELVETLGRGDGVGGQDLASIKRPRRERVDDTDQGKMAPAVHPTTEAVADLEEGEITESHDSDSSESSESLSTLEADEG